MHTVSKAALAARSHAALALLCALVLAQSGAQSQRRTPAARPDGQVSRTSWGRVIGRVYDANSGRPIPGAAVAVRHNGAFAEKDRTAGVTDPLGQYSVQAPLGRVSENFDLGRALNSGIAGLLLGGATNRTKRVDVIRLDMRVTAVGYRPYAGPVSCRSSNPERFEVVMEPVLLVANGSEQVSAPADGWGPVRVQEVTVTPNVAATGDSVLVTARVRFPAADPRRSTQIVCVSRTWGKQRMVADAGDGEALMFRATLKAPKAQSDISDTMTVIIERCPLDLAIGFGVVTAPFEITATESGAQRSAERLQARILDQAGDAEAAFDRWQALCSSPEATAEDWRRLAESAARLRRHDAAIAALERVVALAPDRDRELAMGEHAQELVRSGRYGDVIASYGPMARSDRGGRSNIANPELLAALGLSYVESGLLSDARDALERLLKRPGPVPQAVIDLRDRLTLAEARQAVERQPDDAPSLLRLGRALMDRRRYEEALEPLQKALTLAPDNRSARADLQRSRAAIYGAPESVPAEDSNSIEEAEAEAWIVRGQKPVKSKDFGAWHRLAKLLMIEAVRRGEAGVLEQSLVARALEALEEAVRTGRAGARVNEGIYGGPFGFLSARTVAVSGFAYPEAAWDYVAMESIRALKADPNDGFALLNLATSMHEVGVLGHAGPLLNRLSGDAQVGTERDFLRAEMLAVTGDADGAVEAFRELLRRNPRHPRARLSLARLLSDRGDIASAAATLAEHAEIYGSEMIKPFGRAER